MSFCKISSNGSNQLLCISHRLDNLFILGILLGMYELANWHEVGYVSRVGGYGKQAELQDMERCGRVVRAAGWRPINSQDVPMDQSESHVFLRFIDFHGRCQSHTLSLCTWRIDVMKLQWPHPFSQLYKRSWDRAWRWEMQLSKTIANNDYCCMSFIFTIVKRFEESSTC